MFVIFCAVIMLATNRSIQSGRGSGEPSIPLPTAPALLVGDIADVGG